MITSHQGTEPRGTSTMSRRIAPGTGQDVPSGPEDAARVFAGWMILAVGGLVLAITAMSSGPEVRGSDWSFALVAALASVVAARGLWLGARWAWWAGLVFTVTALFFVLPVTAALLFGPPGEPVGTGWDVVFFPLMTAVMVASLAALWVARPHKSEEKES